MKKMFLIISNTPFENEEVIGINKSNNGKPPFIVEIRYNRKSS